ncbi:DNA polymerase I [Pelotomaculum schinkii]|uniref:5'-3' exonuclease n=1 Tax=Pelotomaculum schinkii TaxID=78350 RepID=A0A4Y7R7Q1_9FIRM|nr:5'-3' exonuclease H3TH domain-containing protein [Pelotomaculum schinkii]TEB04792.1 DNA polymerase I [Pelotomaculum schinkii]
MLVDGNSLLHRCFHAFPPMSAPDGRPTNAVFGMLRLLVNIIDARKPTHLAVAFDLSRNSFRKEAYPEYKANRKETDPDLVPQFSIIREVLKALNIPYFEKELYEADDIIGTLACQTQADYKVKILTGDRDCLQLINEKVSVLLTITGVSKLVECTPESTEKKLGFRHDQVLSMKALAGDHSDNIPGVRGVGEKTALSLLDKYGTIEGVIASASEIPGKLGEKVRTSVEMIRLSQQLATIVCNVSLDVEPESLRLRINRKAGTEILARLGIKSINLDGLVSQSPQVSKPARPTIQHNAGRIVIPSTGSQQRCGICARPIPCRRFVELGEHGKLAFGAKIFWACRICSAALKPDCYKEIP